MKEVNFEFNILYSQIAVFQCGMENPYNDWNDTHVKQGFVWRNGSVGFGTLSDNIACEILIRLSDSFELSDEIIRAIALPFEVKDSGIEIGSVMETIEIEIKEGMYQLVFTVSINEMGNEQYSFNFIKNDNPISKILIADEGLEIPEKLHMIAEPAI